MILQISGSRQGKRKQSITETWNKTAAQITVGS